MRSKQRIPVIVLLVWFAIITTIMLLNQLIDLEVFIDLALLGFLVIIELFAPVMVQPQYMRRIKFVVAEGVLLFTYLAASKILEILAS